MTTSTLTITEFLRERIAEDAEASRRVWDRDADIRALIEVPESVAEYAPGKMLAECEAKRQIVERHHHKPVMGAGGPLDWCACLADWPCPDLLALTSVFADHPDYRDEWSPDEQA